MIVVAARPEDMAAAVRHATSAGLPVAVQATGHGPSVPADGAVLINTRLMNDVEIDPEAATARIGAGAKGGAALGEAARHGLAFLVASTPDVGTVGYLTSGGLPILGRRFGFAADHVPTIELIGANGELRRATAEEHPDLFWAVRGGKGNFGVVTSVETDLVPAGRLYGGGMFFPDTATEEVLGAWLEWTSSQPEEMASSSVALRRFPDMPEVPEPVRGKFMVHVRVAYTGRPEDGERQLRPLRALGPLSDTVADIPHTEIGSVHNDPPGPAPVRDRGILLGELDNGAVERAPIGVAGALGALAVVVGAATIVGAQAGEKGAGQAASRPGWGILALLAGAVLPVQGAVLLSVDIGAPITVGAISFVIATAAMALVFLYVVATGMAPRPTLKPLFGVPWWGWLGGICGAVYVTTVFTAIPAIGAAAVVGLTVTGQQVASVLFDRWGLMRMPTKPVTGARLSGVGLLLVGVVLIQAL